MGVSPKRRKVFILLTVSNPKVFNVLKNIIWKAWLLLGTIQYILEVTRDGELLVLSEDWKEVALECLTQPSRALGTSPRLGLRRPDSERRRLFTVLSRPLWVRSGDGLEEFTFLRQTSTRQSPPPPPPPNTHTSWVEP